LIAEVETRVRSQFDIGLASRKNDAEIRALLRRIVIPGAIRVTFEREPRFFDSCALHGSLCQVVIGRDRNSGRIIGMGTRSVDQGFVNGEPAPVGYLSDLRLEPSYRGGTLIARGYKFFRELHRDGAARLYTTAVFSGNRVALSTIARGRAGLPQYRDLGIIHCPGINLQGSKPEIRAGCQIVRGSRLLLPEIVACLNRNHSRRQFAPVHRERDFLEGGRWLHCRPEDFHVALRHGTVVGALASWDQSGFKQTRIAGYDRMRRWSIPLVNCIRRLTRAAPYPRPGEYVRALHVSFIAVDGHGDNLSIFRALLRHAYNHAVGQGYLYALVSMHERDPLLPGLEDYSLTAFDGRLFCVCYPDGEEAFLNLDQRVPYVEAAIL
jgi:hypothetical protein